MVECSGKWWKDQIQTLIVITVPDEKRLNVLESDEKTKNYEHISGHNCVEFVAT